MGGRGFGGAGVVTASSYDGGYDPDCYLKRFIDDDFVQIRRICY
jgi:hypothetical protein